MIFFQLIHTSGPVIGHLISTFCCLLWSIKYTVGVFLCEFLPKHWTFIHQVSNLRLSAVHCLLYTVSGRLLVKLSIHPTRLFSREIIIRSNYKSITVYIVLSTLYQPSDILTVIEADAFQSPYQHGRFECINACTLQQPRCLGPVAALEHRQAKLLHRTNIKGVGIIGQCTTLHFMDDLLTLVSWLGTLFIMSSITYTSTLFATTQAHSGQELHCYGAFAILQMAGFITTSKNATSDMVSYPMNCSNAANFQNP